MPKFYERKFHQDTDFTTRDQHWPAITKENAAESKRAFTRLRQIMNDLHKPDDEHFFGRQEMRCKALLEGPFYRAVSWAYALVSDYGHSIGRPLTGLVLSVAAGWVVPMVLSCPWPNPCLDCVAESGWGVLGISFSNTFAFLGFHRLYSEPEFLRELALWMKLVSATQSIAGFVLLFFLGLGLRNRFRLK